MKHTFRAIAFALGLLPAIAPAQVPNFPQTLPANTVVGRLGIGPGPSQAIPITTIFERGATAAANKVFAGPVSGPAAGANFRSLVAADIPSGIDCSKVDYNQGGASASTITLCAKLRQFVNVSDFGASNAGTADVTLAVRAAIAAACNGTTPGGIQFSNGSYRFKQQNPAAGASNPTIQVPSNCSVFVDGSATILSEVGPAGGWGFNTALFVNSDSAAGNKNISIHGTGKFKVAAQPVSLTGNTNGTTTVSGLSTVAGLQVGMGFACTADTPAAAVIVSIGASSVVLSATTTGTNTGLTCLAGWSGGPFISMVNVTKSFIGGGLKLLDVQGGGGVTSSWLGFRTVFAKFTDSVINGIVAGYEDKTTSTAAMYGTEDTIHLYGGSKRVAISNISGVSGDDGVMIDIEPTLTGVSGYDLATSDITVSNVSMDSKWGHVFRIEIGAASTVGTISRIVASNISGASNTLAGNSGTDGLPIQDKSNLNHITNVRLQNVTIDASTVGRYGLIVLNSSFVDVSGLTIISPKLYGLFVNNSPSVTVANSNLTTAPRTAATEQVYVTTASSNFKLTHSRISNSTAHGVRILSTAPVVAGNTITSSTGVGLLLDGVLDGMASMNSFISNSSNSVQEVNSANYNSIIANDVRLNGGGSVVLIGANSQTAGNLGLDPFGNASGATTGTSGHVVPYLDGANTWSAAQSFNDGMLVLKGLTSGTLTQKAAAIAGTNTITWPAGTTNFSATGGTSQVVKQVSAGAAFTVGQLACSDLSDASTACVSTTAWTTYTPTITASSGTFTLVSGSGRYKLMGKILHISVAVTVTTVGTATGNIVIPLPSLTAQASFAQAMMGVNVNTGGLLGSVISASGTNINLAVGTIANNVYNVTGVIEVQ